MSATVTIDTGGLSAFAARLREMVADFPIQERKILTASAEIVSEEAKHRTDSEKTRGTIRVIPIPNIDGKQAIAIGAGESGGDILPLLLEGGNGKNKFDEWSHPVFGNGPDVKQKTHPYLAPALRDKTEEIEEVFAVDIQEHLDEFLDEEF